MRIAGCQDNCSSSHRLILGRELSTGEFSKDVTGRLEKEQPYSLIFIDHAEKMDSRIFLWVCNHKRSVIGVLVLIVRDFEKLTEGFPNQNRGSMEWVMARAFRVDLVQEIFES